MPGRTAKGSGASRCAAASDHREPGPDGTVGVEFQAGLLQFMRQHNHTHVATRPQQVDEWTRIVIKAGEALLSFKVDSWQNGVNRNVDGRTVRRVLGYNGNGAHFRRTTDEVAKGGYQEFAFR